MNYFYIFGIDGKKKIYASESLEALRRLRSAKAEQLSAKPSQIYKEQNLNQLRFIAVIKKVKENASKT